MSPDPASSTASTYAPLLSSTQEGKKSSDPLSAQNGEGGRRERERNFFFSLEREREKTLNRQRTKAVITRLDAVIGMLLIWGEEKKFSGCNHKKGLSQCNEVSEKIDLLKR